MSAQEFFPKSENEMLVLGENLVASLKAGDVVYLSGELGAGKTTLVRGMLRGIGHLEAVRSPTFSLIQLYDTLPPVAHVDLYRVKSYVGLGLEDLLESHLLLIEWPDRASGLVDANQVTRIDIAFADEGRRVHVQHPVGLNN
jgi:tRNA threonylcarbamoyladenosine biosynthesis protein TsaE